MAAMMVAIGITSYFDTRRLRDDTERTTKSREIVDAVGSMRTEVRKLQGAQRAFLLSGLEKSLQPYNEAAAALEVKAKDLELLTAQDPDQHKGAEQITHEIETGLELLNKVIEVRRQGGIEAVETLARTGLRSFVDPVLDLLAEIDQRERERIAVWETRAQEAYRQAVMSTIRAVSLGLIAIALFVWLLWCSTRARDRAAEGLAANSEFLDATLNSIGDAVITTDAVGKVTFLNAVAEKLTGWSQEEARGEPLERVFQVINEKTRLPVESPARKTLREGEVIKLAKHSILIARDGTERPIDDSSAPIERHGAVVGTVLVFRDITEHKRVEDALRDSESLLRLATDAAELGMWVWDVETDHVLWLNDRPYQIFGIDPAQGPINAARFVAEFIHPDDVAAAARPGSHFSFQGRLQRGTGEIRWVEFKSGQAETSDGGLLRLHGTVADITERQRSAEVLRDAQARLESTLVAGDVATWSWDIPTDRVFADANMAKLFSISQRDAHGGPLAAYFKVIHEDDQQRVSKMLRRSVETGEPYEAEYRIRGADEQERFVIARGRIERDPNGISTRLLGVIFDVTRQKRAESERARLSETLGLALMAADLGTWEWDPLSDLTTLSDRAAEIYGLRPGQTYTREWMRGLIHLDHRERTREAALRVATDRKDYNVEYPLDRPNEKCTWVAVRGRGIYDAEGRLTRMLGVVQDVSDRKETEETLRDSDRKKDEFLALLAHELRNPLAPIRNGLQVIRLAGGNAQMLDQARAMMDRQLTHMVRLVDDLLDVSRISRNKMELRLAQISLADVIAAAVETARPAVEAAGHTLNVSLPPHPITLSGDLTRLAQVFSNLLTNSAKYTPESGQIWLSVEAYGTEVIVAVRDNGIGIPHRSLPTIFDMFSQVDRSIERSSGGLGIGLALVKGLVEMHGGTVSVESAGSGQGSTFRVRLPIVESLDSTENPDSFSNGRQGPYRRVLVVDDNRDGAESMAMMLELSGDKVRMAHDGFEAIEAAQQFRPEIILMDVGMPRLNGLEATRRIRSESWGQNMTIIAVTGWGQDSDKERSRQAGCDGHLVKPVNLRDLEKMLDDLGVLRQ
jgi:PAS domain S-box-containing protein